MCLFNEAYKSSLDAEENSDANLLRRSNDIQKLAETKKEIDELDKMAENLFLLRKSVI